jgi:aminoglycoside/choline kinase family phosphotransferase
MSEAPQEPLDPIVRTFLDAHCPEPERVCQVIPLKGDASTRRYLRCLSERQASWVLTIYPTSIDERRFSFRQIHDLLRRIGIPVPKIIAVDGVHGLLLQEDLGALSLENSALESPGSLGEWLRTALEYIVVMQVEGTRSFGPEFANYPLSLDEARLRWELDFFLRHYVGDFRKRRVEHVDALQEEFRKMARELGQSPQVFCHRDYQVRNLMVKNETLYVIDFQDARWGPPSYDLASLLKDSIQLDSGQIEESIESYRKALSRRGYAGLPADVFERRSFERQFHVMCLQRMLKALGTYGNQIAVRGISSYGRLVPGTLERALLSLEALREFPATRKLVEEELAKWEPE